MDEIRMATQAEVLSAGCDLRLNKQLRDMLRNDATIKLSAEALSGMELFTRTYTLNLMPWTNSGCRASRCRACCWSARPGYAEWHPSHLGH